MRYIVELHAGYPDGTSCGPEYYIADTEREMEAMIATNMEYVHIRCLGPAVIPNDWTLGRFAETRRRLDEEKIAKERERGNEA